MYMNYQQLTKKQKSVLNIILSYIQSVGFPPSIREIKDRAEINSLRGVTIQLEAIEKAGLITRRKGARGITVNPVLLTEKEETISIPLLISSIPAGVPNDADGHSDENIDVSLIQTKGIRNVFAIRVKGDSMINAGIIDGDTAIIFPQPVANDGDIVAASLDNDEITLKKYRVVEGIPMLIPANPKYQPITGYFEIQGKLINIIKKSSSSS